MTKKLGIICIIMLSMCALLSCKIYSFTGATIAGKTINIYNFDNRAPNVVPSLSPLLTEKVRTKILSQTGLAAINDDKADYVMKSTITQYAVSISGVAGSTQASQNRLTIGIDVEFINNLDEKASFKKSFTRFADFPANQQLQSQETRLIEEIGTQLAEDIFNKAFVNW